MTTIGPVTDDTLADFNKKKKRKSNGKLETAQECITRLMKENEIYHKVCTKTESNNNRKFARG
jgi:hypothetical protein